MTFRLRIDRLAQQEIDRFAVYAADYSEAWAFEQFSRLNHVLSVELANGPLQRNFFVLTGAPYRAYLFKVGRRTRYWIIYTVDETKQTVDILRFWNASRDPAAFAAVEDIVM